MRIKTSLFCFLSIFCFYLSHAQQEVDLGSVGNFTSTFFSQSKRLKASAEIVEEIYFSDTLTIRYVVNKVEDDEAGSRVYGLLQAPYKGGIFIVNRHNEITGDVFFANWNKTLSFETRNGRVYLKEESIEKIICIEKEKPEVEAESLIRKKGADPAALAVDVKKLQSYPGAKAVVYIDVDGNMSGQRWANSYNGGVQFYLTPANISDDNIYSIWRVMSEDYKPFDINITTDSTIFLQYATNRRQRLVVTRNSSWQTLSSTGIAWVNGFSSGDEPCFSFPGGFSSSNPMPTTSAEKLGEVSSHEVGHTVGLSHDGSSSTSYYSGHGNWAPIMGSGYNRNVTQWSKGEYANANQLQDDLAIITGTTNGFGYKTDDCGNTYAASKSIIIATGGVVNAADNTGVIERSTDIDVFKFSTTGGTVTLHLGTALPKPNLDIKASLYNSSNVLIVSSDVANLTYADISASLVAGNYYITIEGVGYGDPLSTGYSNYASLGYYEISGTIPSSGTGNQLPTVSIISPSNGGSFIAPASITISATAADADGTISKVEFYNGSTLINTTTTSPYSYSWTGVITGTYSLTAKAYDNSGAVTTSNTVSITVTSATNQLPSVSITSPTNGSSFTAPASITINATATDSDGTISKVEFYNGATLLTTDNSSPYSYTWTGITTGTYSLTAKAYDNSSGVSTSSIVSVTVTSGTTNCSAPAWNSSTVYLGDSGSGGTGKGEVVSYNNRQYRALWWTQNNAPGVGTNNPWLDLGACAPANVLPTVSITAPTNDATFTAPASITITANATDSNGTVAKVEFYNGTTLLNSDNASPYSYSWTGVTAGTYSITAKAYDNTGAITTSSAVSIIVNPPTNVLPTISIAAPTNGATFTAPASVTITANATDADGTISKVEFYNGTTLLNSDNASPYSYSWTGVTAATYSLTAKAYDNTGAVTTSSAVSITVNAANVSPAVSITAPANGATYTAPASITITANATDSDGIIAKVEFYNGTTLLNSDNASPYSYGWTGVTAGTYSITAKAYDNTGAVTTSSTVSITVNAANVSPTVSITAPANGATYTAPASVVITASATDADGTISKVEFYNGTTLLNSDNVSPYSYAWTGVTAGTYSLTAKAYDNTGAVTTSSAVSITVNPPVNQLPVVSVTAPANGATYTAPASVVITASATDADGTISKVEFYNGTTLLNSDNASPYSYAWTGVTSGTYSLTAKAYDNTGAVTTSSIISITVNPTQTGTEDCSNILAWNSNAIYVANDLVTYNGFKYKANYWTKNNNPSTSSNGQYDFWFKLGECLSGTAPVAGPQVSMSPTSDTSMLKDDVLDLTIKGLTAGTVKEVIYYLYEGTTLVTKINVASPALNAEWPAIAIGDYSLQVVVKDNKDISIYANAISIKVTQVTSIFEYNATQALLAIPNPNNSRFYLSVPSGMNLSGARVELINMIGDKVYESMLLSDGEEVTPEHLPSGMYLLKVTQGGKVLMTKIKIY